MGRWRRRRRRGWRESKKTAPSGSRPPTSFPLSPQGRGPGRGARKKNFTSALAGEGRAKQTPPHLWGGGAGGAGGAGGLQRYRHPAPAVAPNEMLRTISACSFAL